MALSNSNHDYKIFVSATPNNYGYKDDQSLKSPLIKFKCNIKMSYIPDKPDKSIPSYIPHHDSWHEFEHPADELTRDFISDMFANIRIPFLLRNLHWKKCDYDKESVPLLSTDDVLTSMLDVCRSMDSAARESGRKKLLLLVFIKKQVIVPHGEYLAMLKAKKAQEILHQVEDMVRLQAQGWEFRESDWEDIANVLRQAGLGNSVRNALDLVMERARSESTEQEVVRLVPAAATSIQALEKVT
ncbi:hypothetical protein REPUB_Repub07fG0207900 [Reevesia pubescens]